MPSLRRGSHRALAGMAAGLLVALAAGADDLVPLPPEPAGVPFPTERWPEGAPGADVDAVALSAAVEDAFAPSGRSGVADTRALLVVRGGRLVFERYAEGFGPTSRFHSWSAAKSFTQALVGRLVQRGALALDDPAPVPAWQGEGDPRGAITLRQLLQMTAGLDNEDDGMRREDPAQSFEARLLFGDGAADTAGFAAARPAIHAPGTHWAYSTGTSAIVSAIVGRLAGPDPARRGAFARRTLFEPIGMRSATLGFDAAGTPLGGSHLYASARDYARFGLLYLRDGVWDGERLLPEGWVDFSRTRAPAPDNGVYGAHFWLNLDPMEGQFKILPGGPRSAFAASGNAGQSVLILPTHDLVVVRLGEQQATTWPEMNAYLAAIVAAFPPLDAARMDPR